MVSLLSPIHNICEICQCIPFHYYTIIPRLFKDFNLFPHHSRYGS